MKKVYLGCGKDHQDGYINIDIYPFEGVDLIADITRGLPMIEDSSVDYVFSQDFLEHLPPESKIPVMNEIWRILKAGGKMEHIIPLAGTRNDFGSPSHLSHWHSQQFEHWDIDSYRYTADHEYEGFVGGFRKIISELGESSSEEGPQTFHVLYEAIK